MSYCSSFNLFFLSLFIRKLGPLLQNMHSAWRQLNCVINSYVHCLSHSRFSRTRRARENMHATDNIAFIHKHILILLSSLLLRHHSHKPCTWNIVIHNFGAIRNRHTAAHKACVQWKKNTLLLCRQSSSARCSCRLVFPIMAMARCSCYCYCGHLLLLHRKLL